MSDNLILPEVAKKLRALLNRRLSQRRKLFLERKPENCGHGMVSHGKIRCPVIDGKVCTQPVCVDCGHYECGNDRASVDRSFFDVVSDPAACSKAYPKIAILMWVLHIGNHDGTAAAVAEEVKVNKRVKGDKNGEIGQPSGEGNGQKRKRHKARRRKKKRKVEVDRGK